MTISAKEKQSILNHIIKTIAQLGGRVATRDLVSLWCGDSLVVEKYNWNPYRMGQQTLRKLGIIAVDKTVYPNLWYLK